MSQSELIVKSEEELASFSPKVYLGSGPDYREGWINVDVNKNIKADIYHDANVVPWPFEDNSIKVLKVKQSLEHFSISLIDFFTEARRVLTTDGIILLEIPNSYFWRFRLEYLFGINTGSYISIYHTKYLHPRELFSVLRLLGYRWKVIKTGLPFLPIALSESNLNLQIRRLY